MTPTNPGNDEGTMLDALFEHLQVDTDRLTYAETDQLRAIAEPRPRADGRVDVSVHIQPNVPGKYPPTDWAVEAVVGESAPIGGRINQTGRAKLEGLLPGRSYRLQARLVSAAAVREAVPASTGPTWQWASVGAVLTLAPKRLAWSTGNLFDTHGRQTRGERPFYEWAGDGSLRCYVYQDESGRYLFAVDVLGDSNEGTPASFTLVDVETGLDSVTGWLMIHDDPHNPGHQVAAARLELGSPIPANCQIRLVKGMTGYERRTDVVLGLLRDAMKMCAEAPDREAWRLWVRREVDGGRLPGEAIAVVADEARSQDERAIDS